MLVLVLLARSMVHRFVRDREHSFAAHNDGDAGYRNCVCHKHVRTCLFALFGIVLDKEPACEMLPEVDSASAKLGVPCVSV